MSGNEPAATSSGYLPIGELRLYYELLGAREGEREPLVLLHGGMGTFRSSFGRVLPALAASYRVIGLEQQGHGHTADLDCPLRFPDMVAATAAALDQLGVAPAHVWGFSDGGILALGLAIDHPALVRSLTVVGTNFNNEGLVPGMVDVFQQGTVEELAAAMVADLPPAMADAYTAVAPHPGQWPTLVAKVFDQALTFPGWPEDALRRITAPALVIAGDADIVTPEHSVALSRLLPNAHLAILPGTDHAASMLGEQSAWTLAMFQACQARLASER